MATVTKRGNGWMLSYSRDGKRVRRYLGLVSEEAAQVACREANIGRVPSSATTRRDRMFSAPEVYELYRHCKERARERGIPFALTRDDVDAMLIRADGRCEITGIPFDKVHTPDGCSRRPWYPSIDRIDSRGAYVPDNCRVLCVAVNIALNEWGMETLKRLSQAVVFGE